MNWLRAFLYSLVSPADWTKAAPTPKFKVNVHEPLIPRPPAARFADGSQTDLSRRAQDAWADYYIEYDAALAKLPVKPSQPWTQSPKRPSSPSISRKTPSNPAEHGREK